MTNLLNIGGSCCDGIDCPSNCTTVAPPVSVTINATPGESTATKSFPVTTDPFSCHYYLQWCFAEAGWAVHEEGSCVSPWPTTNANDTRYAVGTPQTCVACAEPYAPPLDYSLWYDEWQVANRVKSWVRKYWEYELKIDPYSTAGLIKITLSIRYNLCSARAQHIGIRNRLRRVDIDCTPQPNPPQSQWYGVVTALSDWYYPADLTLPEPEKCVDISISGCFSETTPVNNYACSTTNTVIGQARGYVYHFGVPTCVDYDVHTTRYVAAGGCRATDLENYQSCYFANVDDILEFGWYIHPVHVFFCGGNIHKQWAKVISCADLYSGPIVLDLVGDSVGGEIVQLFGRSEPALRNLVLRTTDCEFTHSTVNIVHIVPDTITVTFT